jgi:putative Holliday junction resolvase
MRKLAVDLGDVRIGLAISDMMCIIASPLETIKTKGEEADADYVTALAKERSCDTIVVGYPVNMDGTIGDRARKSERFAELLRTKSDIKVVLQDERMSSQTAERYLLEADMKRDKRKTVIDQVAASVILRQYLSKIKS